MTALKKKRARFNSLLAAGAATLLAISGVALAPTTAVAAEGDTTLDLELTPAEGSLTINVDVVNIPEESPGVYVTFIEEGNVAGVPNPDPYSRLIKTDDFVDQGGSATLTIPGAGLDRDTDYEVIAWPHMSFPVDTPENSNLYARAAVELAEADWDVIFPSAVPEITLVEVTEVTNSHITVGVTGRNFADVAVVNGDDRTVQVGLAEKGADLSLPGVPVVTTSVIDGNIEPDDVWDNASLHASVGALDRSKNYEVIIWPSGAATEKTSSLVLMYPSTGLPYFRRL